MPSESTLNVVIVTLVVLSVLGLFLLTLYITNKNEGTNISNNKNTEAVFDYDEILLGSSFNRNDKEYLVLYYDMSDSSLVGDLASSVGNYTSKDDSLNLYKVDMSNTFNKKYTTEDDSNNNPKDVSELLINGPTLIRFVDGEVEEYIEGVDDIKDYFE